MIRVHDIQRARSLRPHQSPRLAWQLARRLTRRCSRRAATLVGARRSGTERRPAAERQVVRRTEIKGLG
jgi:hypothetical protein